MEQIIINYENACNILVAEFEKKQEIDFDGWVGDEIGEIALFSGEYFFNLSDIVLDLKTNQPKGLILKWFNESIDFHHYINYKSYKMGLRYE